MVETREPPPPTQQEVLGILLGEASNSSLGPLGTAYYYYYYYYY